MISLIFIILLIYGSFCGTDLYVGYLDKENNFNTVLDAVNKAEAINPSDESNRVTIHISPGTYRQQIIVKTPYVTFINDEPSKGDAIITWYYGVGYKYYSAGKSGYYDENLAKSKQSKNPPKYSWGATVILFDKAQYFRAENIVFENSFNRYITKEEIEDGVELIGESSGSSITVQRTESLDVKSQEATERAAALALEASYSEFLNCRIYSGQDTLYTKESPLYFKNCVIEGGVDYIFGTSNAVFDSCELRFKGYSTNPTADYITAAKAGKGDYTGYLMYNCKITKAKGLSHKTGYFGRPWAITAKVTYVNTVLQDEETIHNEGWHTMGNVKPEDVEGFYEYNTKLENGAIVSTSQRKGHILSQEEMENINIKDYINGWTPSFMG